MIEIALIAVILILSGLMGFMDYSNRKERKSLINAILAKNNDELVNLELADKTKVEIGKDEEPDIVPSDTVSNEEYEKLITNT